VIILNVYRIKVALVFNNAHLKVRFVFMDKEHALVTQLHATNNQGLQIFVLINAIQIKYVKVEFVIVMLLNVM
jgi:hypothetical protein